MSGMSKIKRFLMRLAAVCCAAALLTVPAFALSVQEAVALLEAHYVDELPEEAYTAQTLDELIAAIGDPYTYYMTQEEYEAFLGSVEQETTVTGIGAAIQYTDEGILLTRVLDGSGALDAGLVAGDVIVAVEGTSCVPGSEAHRAMLMGEAGTSVAVTVRHADGTLNDYVLQRRTVAVHNTYVTVLDGHIGYIDCDSFGTDTGDYFISALTEHPDVTAWIVDLRGNGGGVASSAVDAAGAFLGFGSHLYLSDREGTVYGNYYTDGYLTEAPAVVLTDGFSASASEIVAADIRDCSAGILIGERTFGKGVAQSVLDESMYAEFFDGDGLKVTAYRFYSTGYNTSDRIGVIPTLLVDSTLAESVARALCAAAPENCDGWLRLRLNGYDFYLAPETNDALVAAIFEALPPTVGVWLGNDAGWLSLSQADALSLRGVAVTRRDFADVAESPYADKINTLAAYGILLGDGTGNYHPENSLTRAELCALLAQALNVSYDGASRFADVAEDDWFAPDVGAMEALGLVQGVGDGRFAPDDTLTWQEYITVVARLGAYLNLMVEGYLDGQDEQTLASDETLSAFADWARPGADAMVHMFLDADDNPYSLLPLALEEIAPAAAITRSEAAAVLYNLLDALAILNF